MIMHITHGTCTLCTSWSHFAHHDHTHSHVHVRVYKYTHCGSKGHLAKFCYDKVNSINFANKNVWVPYNTNPRGPKRKWVPKSPPFVFNVGVSSHMTWEDWCLGSGCMSYMVIQNWCTAIKEVWWEDHHVLET